MHLHEKVWIQNLIQSMSQNKSKSKSKYMKIFGSKNHPIHEANWIQVQIQIHVSFICESNYKYIFNVLDLYLDFYPLHSWVDLRPSSFSFLLFALFPHPTKIESRQVWTNLDKSGLTSADSCHQLSTAVCSSPQLSNSCQQLSNNFQ